MPGREPFDKYQITYIRYGISVFTGGAAAPPKLQKSGNFTEKSGKRHDNLSSTTSPNTGKIGSINQFKRFFEHFQTI